MTVPFVEALAAVGDTLYERGDAAGAREMWGRCLRDGEPTPEGQTLQAYLRIRQGDDRGWTGYDARWGCRRFRAGYARPEYDALPQWSQGEEPDTLAGRHLLVHGEQGLGDQIQTLRYLRWLRLYADRVTVEVLPPLLRLARASFPWATVIARGDPLPAPVDVAVPSLSLPARFGGRYPADVPYLLSRDEVLVHKTSAVGKSDAGITSPRVGIVWAGSAGHANDRNRSIAVETLAPLWAVPGVEWVSLQVGDRADEAPAHLHRISPTDFADTAAVVGQLDLVIAVDTSTAHLAGALGVPTWLLLPRLPDHRWELERDDTPWYPTMRLYRQPVAGAWGDVIARVATDLNHLLRV